MKLIVHYIKSMENQLTYGMKFSFKHVDTNNGKYQPKDNTNYKDVEDIR